MVLKKPIKCPKCSTIVGYEEDYMFCVLTGDVKCPNCGEVVIHCNQPIFNY